MRLSHKDLGLILTSRKHFGRVIVVSRVYRFKNWTFKRIFYCLPWLKSKCAFTATLSGFGHGLFKATVPSCVLCCFFYLYSPVLPNFLFFRIAQASSFSRSIPLSLGQNECLLLAFKVFYAKCDDCVWKPLIFVSLPFPGSSAAGPGITAAQILTFPLTAA